MYGGDEVSSLVFDVGSFNARFGCSGEDTPKYVFQSYMGVSSSSNFFGENELRFCKPGIKVVNPMSNSGYIENIEYFESLLNHVYGKCFNTDPKEHPILFSEPVVHNKEYRTNVTQLMFEKFEIPALFITKSPVLSAFSCGRSTCLVFDSGHNCSTATPVNDGYALQKSLIKYEIGGSIITNDLLKLMNDKSKKITPHYKFTKEKTNNDLFQTMYYSESDFYGVDPSYENYWIKETIRELKEQTLSVHDDNFLYNKDIQVKPSFYELPDGTNIELKDEKLLLLEKFFNPQRDIPGFSGFPQMIIDAINKGDIDVKKDMFSNIFVCGGNTLFQGFAERLQKQMINTAPQNVKVKVVTHPTISERRFSSWIGGSILSSLGTFHQMWFSKQEYEEHGSVLIERKCA